MSGHELRARRAPSALVAVLALAALLAFAGSAPARSLGSVTLDDPGDQTIVATSDCNQTFCGNLDPSIFSVSDTDYPADQVTVTCSGPNGWTFIWGMTHITCRAHDPGGNFSAAPGVSFNVNVTVPPPTFPNPPGPLTFPATGPAGGPATFATPSAVDVGNQSVPVTCDHTSGVVYPIGATTVTCTAQIQRNDSQGNSIGGLPSATTQFTVTITPQSTGGGGGGGGGTGGGGGGGGTGGGGAPAAGDTTAPTIAQHRDITVDATGHGGAVVRYTVTATDPDNETAQVTVACSPASGTTFHLAAHARTRRTTVSCAAHDPAGNNATPVTFTVTVVGFDDQLSSLELLVNRSSLSPAHKVALTTTLVAADHSFKAGSTVKAKAKLRTFITQVLKLRSHTAWIGDATRAIDVAS